MSAEGVKLDGTAILTTMTTFDAVKSAEQMAQETKRPEADDARPSASGGVGGLLGGLAKSAAQEKGRAKSRRRARRS